MFVLAGKYGEGLIALVACTLVFILALGAYLYGTGRSGRRDLFRIRRRNLKRKNATEVPRERWQKTVENRPPGEPGLRRKLLRGFRWGAGQKRIWGGFGRE